MLLAVDTSTRYAGVALSDAPLTEGGRVLSSRSWYSTANHTAELMPAVSQILERQALTPKNLSGIAVALGPGGFSALRVGVSAVKGLAFTAGTPIVGVGTLDLEASPFLGSGLPVCSMLDAGRSEVASALFGADGVRAREDTVCTVEELADSIKETTLFCGEGMINWGELIRDKLGSLAGLVEPSPASRLWALIALGWERLARGDTSDLSA